MMTAVMVIPFGEGVLNLSGERLADDGGLGGVLQPVEVDVKVPEPERAGHADQRTPDSP
jgi:hypothetical protein